MYSPVPAVAVSACGEKQDECCEGEGSKCSKIKSEHDQVKNEEEYLAPLNTKQ